MVSSSLASPDGQTMQCFQQASELGGVALSLSPLRKLKFETQ